MPSRFQKSNDLIEGMIIGGNLLFLAVVIGWDWPMWWVNINYEKGALTWFSSIQLWTIAIVSLHLALRHQARIWYAMAFGFFLFSFDERFQFHERLRDLFLKPHGIGTHLPGIHPGDFLLLVVAGVGLGLSKFLWKELEKKGRVFFAIGVSVALVSVLLDALDISINNETLRALQFTEEILETFAQMFFLLAFSSQVWREAK